MWLFAFPRERLVPRRASAEELFTSAQRWSSRGFEEKALVLYRKVTRLAPQCREGWLNLGISKWILRRPRGALRDVEKALEVDEAYHEAQYNKALILDGLGRTEEALESLRRAEKQALGMGDRAAAAEYACALGLMALSGGEALEAYDRAAELGRVEALVNRGELLSDLGRWEEALESHSKALQVVDAELRGGVMYNMACSHAAMGGRGEMEEVLQELLGSGEPGVMEVLAIMLNFKGGAEALACARAEEELFMARQEPLEAVEIFRRLRRLEEDPQWISERLWESAKMKGTAYGTTWAQSWWDLAHRAELAWRPGEGDRMVVLGSSLGWQCFLGHLHLRYPECIGYELLASQVRESRRLAREFQLQASVSFHCQDALEAELSGALIWLNSYAWPMEVKEALHERLLELEGARVVSYEPLPDLDLEFRVPISTSWSSELAAHVYRVPKKKSFGMLLPTRRAQEPHPGALGDGIRVGVCLWIARRLLH